MEIRKFYAKNNRLKRKNKIEDISSKKKYE